MQYVMIGPTGQLQQVQMPQNQMIYPMGAAPQLTTQSSMQPMQPTAAGTKPVPDDVSEPATKFRRIEDTAVPSATAQAPLVSDKTTDATRSTDGHEVKVEPSAPMHPGASFGQVQMPVPPQVQPMMMHMDQMGQAPLIFQPAGGQMTGMQGLGVQSLSMTQQAQRVQQQQMMMLMMMQQQQQSQQQLRMQMEQQRLHQSKTVPVAPRALPRPATALDEVTPEVLQKEVQTYVGEIKAGRFDAEQSVSILNPRVVQRSYGSEKRFFCPPPRIQLSGPRWCSNSDFTTPSVSVTMADAQQQFVTVPLTTDFLGISRNQYISDTDKRKCFSLQYQIDLAPALGRPKPAFRHIGTFTSHSIKVISKPSKKKQTMANIDMCIRSGSEVCFFNRVRSQSGSTRFLDSSSDGFVISTSDWGTFKVELEDTVEAGVAGSTSSIPVVMYGSPVTMTGTKRTGQNPVIRCKFRKVLKTSAIDAVDEPISQLQKVAIYVIDSDRQYIRQQNDAVSFFTAVQSATDPTADEVDDDCIWTVSNADRIEYRFVDTMDIAAQGIPVSPAPSVEHIKSLGGFVELYGINFTSHHKVWFDDVEALTIFRCRELLLCEPPKLNQFSEDTADVKSKKVILTISNEFGVLYRLRHTYTYDIDPLMMLAAGAAASS